MKNSVVESLRKANIMVSYFLRSDHNPYRRGRKMYKEVEMISEEQQSLEMTEVASNAKGFNTGSIYDKIPELEVGEGYHIDSEGVKMVTRRMEITRRRSTGVVEVCRGRMVLNREDYLNMELIHGEQLRKSV